MSKTGMVVGVFIMLLAAVSPADADEGMWLLNKLPAEQLKSEYGFVPDDAWVQQVLKSCMRVGKGGSASFVSPNGLVMTNHHVGSGAIAKLSTAERDLQKTGFYAPSTDQELKCPDMKLYQPAAIEDVTERVNAAARPGMSPVEQKAAQDKVIAEIEKEAKQRTGLSPELVKLYHGARYHLYLYKVYDDVRLVMAPEQQIAFFGGDLDNFGYPRYDLDVCFLRAYEDGKPAHTEHYLKWSAAGPSEGQAVFMAGNPARTRRMYSVEHLKFLRDVELPLILKIYNQREVALQQFAMVSEEHARVGKNDLFYTQNGRKAFGGILAGLLDERIMQRKREHEDGLKAFFRHNNPAPAGQGDSDPWIRLSESIQDMRQYYPTYFLLENRRSGFGQLHKIARTLVRVALEREKPDDQRLPGFRDADLKASEAIVFSEAPIYEELEQLRVADALTRFARLLGGNHPVVMIALAGQTPEVRATEILSGTQLKDMDYRRQLWDGGLSAVRASGDSMIRLAMDLEPVAHDLIMRYEKEYQGVETAAYAQIAEAAFGKHGESIYPDATHTIRLSIGTMLGYQEGGKTIPPTTTIGGAFEYAEAHKHTPPFNLPDSWMTHRGDLQADTPFNFVSTNDIIGGNSGSPCFNKDLEIVGIVFDGNIQSLVWDVAFDQKQARSVSVHSQAIIEALKKVYQADALVDELLQH